MMDEVKKCVDSRTKFLDEYFTIPDDMQHEVQTFITDITLLGDACSSATEFEEKFVSEGLSDRFNGILPKCTPKPVKMTKEQKQQSRTITKEMLVENREELDPLARRIVYTGPIDAFFGYRLGYLEYRSVRFETEVLDMPNFQGNAAVNYTDRETPWTRIIEHKWFEFGKDAEGNELPKTVISREYSAEWKPGDEPYYPVNDEKNGALYAEYKKLAEQESRIIFGGRLGEYKYYDMDAVIASALAKAEEELGRR